MMPLWLRRERVRRWFRWFGRRCDSCGRRVWKPDPRNAMLVGYARDMHDGSRRPDEIYHVGKCYNTGKRERYVGRRIPREEMIRELGDPSTWDAKLAEREKKRSQPRRIKGET